jgi:hypothetical protein
MCKCAYTTSPDDFLHCLYCVCYSMSSKMRRACTVSRFRRRTNMLVIFSGKWRKFSWENWEKPNAPVKKRVFELAMSCYRSRVEDCRVKQQRIESRQSFVDSLLQCFSTFVRPRPGKFFFYKTRARSQQIVGLQAIFMTGHKQRYSLSRMLKDLDV